MTSKQRANLRSLAQNEDTIFQIGKDNLSENLIKAVADALEARELIKLSVLKSSEYTPIQIANELAGKTGGEVVSTIGNKLILYKKSTSKTFKHIEF